MSAAPTTFHGWACHGKGQEMVWEELPLRAEDDYSVDMDVTHCGICGSDVHTMEAHWGQPNYPVCVGHEITGVCTRVGKKVTNVKVGDRIGVGAQSGSCHECGPCKSGFENLCRGGRGRYTGTYNSFWPNGDKSFGGYATKWRGDCRFVFKIPDNMTNEIACTFFCAGVTTYAPLKRHHVGPDSVVGVMGVGGLGHYGIMWAKAMGAKVIAMSHSDKKRDVAKELGADDYIVTSNPEEMDKAKGQFTHILCTGTGRDFKWETYTALFKPNGIFINVGLPEWNFPEVNPMTLAMSQVNICGSAIGSPNEIEDMLKFAAEKNVRPWIKKYPMKEAPKAIEDFKAGLPRFRFVLEN
ncbi:chaperonin 10-like protein [Cokeromyces recurvatus]|uniref:chaperonin 10-like protein n=1 Tax=Cokeromyces recurvatus TaxID=90255 RepID=UPI00221F8CBC|nr:chaperonin 10-like protein [Cokeromyces recurvatus]KAI7898559.1 chaperonin 10-like protein [Cokeromyces recurvatus]